MYDTSSLNAQGSAGSPMVPSMWGPGKQARGMGRADACMHVETSTRVSGWAMPAMGMEAAYMPVETSTKVLNLPSSRRTDVVVLASCHALVIEALLRYGLTGTCTAQACIAQACSAQACIT